MTDELNNYEPPVLKTIGPISDLTLDDKKYGDTDGLTLWVSLSRTIRPSGRWTNVGG